MKRKYLLILYLVFVCVVLITSSTLAKYIHTSTTKTSFTIGDKLYFNYERSDLFRNNKLIVGYETEYDDDGIIHKRIETMNVMPGDDLSYHFYVSNYNSKTLDYNGLVGEFLPITTAMISLPVKGQTYDVNCTISFRQVPTDGSVATTQFSLLTNKIALPPYEQEKVKYEFKINCILDDQLSNTTSDEYFGETLSIYLFINSASSI